MCDKLKNSKIFLSIVYLLLSTFTFLLFVKISSHLHFSYALLYLFECFNIFILFITLLPKGTRADFIYKKRYLIGLYFLLILVIGKFNGSSIEKWDNIIEPDYQVEGNVIVGKTRGIRSDEWLVSTPITLTQAANDKPFNAINTILRDTDTLVTLYPNLPAKASNLLSAPNNTGYLILDTERAYSLSWYFIYFVLFFATFEMFMILTSGSKKFSFVGSVLITLSPVVQWWQSASIPAYGALAVTLFYYFIKEKNKWKKLLLSILFGYSGFLYIMCLYPAWQVPYAYCYLILLIWILIKEKKDLAWKNLLYLFPTLIVIIGLMVTIFIPNIDTYKAMTSTVYPGARMNLGGGEYKTLFSYVASFFYPYKDIGNPCELAQYISLFPIPMFYAIYIMIKNKKVDLFLTLSVIVSMFLIIWAMFPLPKIVSRVTLMYMSTEPRVQTAIGYLSILMIVYILSKYEKNDKINKKQLIISFVIGLVSSFITVKISNSVLEDKFPDYLSLCTSLISLIVFSIVIGLFILNNKKTNIILSVMFVIISIICGAFVSPIYQGLDVFYEKPLSKEIQKLVSENKDYTFMTVFNGTIPTNRADNYIANYIAVNGAKTVNTTNQIPNLKLYYKLDKNKKYENIYNRYEHVLVNLVEDETNFELIATDMIVINLNYDDICLTDTNYLVTISSDGKGLEKFEKIYNKSNISIYKTSCAVK